MPKLLQINITANWGSTGRIAEQIGLVAMRYGWESYIAYGRWANTSRSHLIKIGSTINTYMHYAEQRLFDNEGLNSSYATKKLIKQILAIQPDIIHLHNIHDHYLNYKILFEFLKDYDKPVVWTLHDCWNFTGHCFHFEWNGCYEWKKGCRNCQIKDVYSKCTLFHRSNRNYNAKKESFTSVTSLTLVPVSEWLEKFLHESFLKKCNIQTIHNGIDLNVFRPVEDDALHDGDSGRFNILGVSSVWSKTKGLADFVRLREILPEDCHITLIGLSRKQIKQLPSGIHGIERTNNVEELVEYYNRADVFVNPTYEDNFPTVNLEALACGTPVITYRTGGSPEAIDEKTGGVVEQGDVAALATAIREMRTTPLSSFDCRLRALTMFDKDKCYDKYIDLYKELLN